MNGVNTADNPDPLMRFDAFPVKALDTDNDGVIDIPPVPFSALTPPEYVGGVVNLSDANIQQLVSTFNLARDTIGDQVYNLLTKTDPSLQSTADQARSLILNQKYNEAVNLVLNKTTPAEVSLWCGSELHPLYVRWVVSIPAIVSCTPDARQALAMVASAPDFTTLAEATAQQNSPTDPVTGGPGAPTVGKSPVTDIEIQYSVGALAGDSSRHLAGFTYANASLAMNTRVDQTWTIDAQLHRLDTRAPLTADTTFEMGLPGAFLRSGSFSDGDAVHFGNGTLLSRERSYWVAVNATSVTFNGTLAWSAPLDEVKMRLFQGSATPLLSKWGGMTEDFASGLTTRLIMANLAEGLHIKARAEARADVIIPYRSVFLADSWQPKEIPQDKFEARATSYLGANPQGSVQIVGLPQNGVTLFRFAIRTPDRPDVEGADALVNEAPQSIVHMFRAVLVSQYHGSSTTSATGDYASRVIILTGTTHDPFGKTALPWRFVAGCLHGFDWININGNDTQDWGHVGMLPMTSTQWDHNISGETPGAEWGYFTNTSATVNWTQEGIARAVPDATLNPLLYIVPMMGSTERTITEDATGTKVEL